MAHIHSVHDTDNHFSVNSTTRAISNISSSKTKVVQYDHNSERFTFEVPRYIEEHDMMQCNEVQVHYINIASNRANQKEGVYTITDMEVCADDENLVLGTWLISNNATQYAGTLSFLLRFVCRTDSTIDYVWNTEPYSGITVASGMCNSAAVESEYADILSEWEARIEAIEQDGAEDGVSPIVEMTKTDGVTTLKITDAEGVKTTEILDGTDGKDGTNGVDGKDGADGKDGVDGEDGYTPVKGTDYFTDADKEELVAAVVAEIGYTYGTEDLEAGVTELEEGKLYFVYE